MANKTNLKTFVVMAVILLGMWPAIAAGATIYVDADRPTGGDGTTWANAYKYLQDALYKPPTGGDEIWVAEGTYKPDEDEGGNVTPGNRSETFQLRNGVEIYGGYAGYGAADPNERDPNVYETILSGDLNGDDGPDFANNADNSYHVVTGSGTDETAVLDGFTITAGNNPLFPNSGGGMYNYKGSPTLTNCTFSDNSADYTGGGMCNNSSSPTLTNCTFSGNFAHDGGGMYNRSHSSPTLTNCTFTGNSADCGGGMVNLWNSSPTLTNCTFSGNSVSSAGGGIWNYNYSGPTLTNCTFSGNSAVQGGGMLNSSSSPTVTNCTFSTNSANRGGGMANYNSSPTLTNCILWGDSASSGGPEIYNYNSTPTVTYSDVQGGWPGEGNINADPCFVEPDSNDFHLLAGSPCIDAGDNTAVPPDTTDLDGDGNTTEPIPFDLDGNPRIVDGNDDGNLVVDMGAFEAMVSCFGVNHLKIGTKAGKKGNKVELKGTFSPALPIDFAVDDVAYIIDDGQGNALAFLIPAGSFKPEGKPDKQKFKFHSPKGSEPDIKAEFDFDKCKFELKAKRVQGTDEITSTTLTIELWAGANLVEEVVQVQVKPKHTEYKRKPKLNCCPKCKGIALLEVTSDQGVFVFEPDPGKEKLKRKTVVDDGVNGRVKIDTSCSKPLEVGDVFGVYTVTDLIKIFDDLPDGDT